MNDVYNQPDNVILTEIEDTEQVVELFRKLSREQKLIMYGRLQAHAEMTQSMSLSE